MIPSRLFLLRGVSSTVLAYALSLAFRFASNTILTRLLALDLTHL
jgi:hypothetical protein